MGNFHSFVMEKELIPAFKVVFLEDAVTFLENMEPKARMKVYYNIRKAQCIQDPELFKKLNEHIRAFRTLYQGKAYRLFAFRCRQGNSETVVVTTHGILKKTQRTPPKEIRKAEEIRKQYLETL